MNPNISGIDLGSAVDAAARAVAHADTPAPVGPPPQARRARARLVLLAVAALTLVATLVWQWDALRAPKADPAVSERGLILAMISAQRRVFDFRDTTGRFPDRLDQVGPAADNLSYAVRGDTVRLAAKNIDGDSLIVGFAGNPRHAYRLSPVRAR